MNLTPDGPHLLDTSAVILMRHHGVVASPDAFVAFPTLGEGITPMSAEEAASLPPWTDEEADAFERVIQEEFEQIEEPESLP